MSICWAALVSFGRCRRISCRLRKADHLTAQHSQYQPTQLPLPEQFDPLYDPPVGGQREAMVSQPTDEGPAVAREPCLPERRGMVLKSGNGSGVRRALA